MSLNILYYWVKPFISRRIQITFRRWYVSTRIRPYDSVWPINENASIPPDGWNGWPDGKRFALVLTHDVEGPYGFEKLDALVTLEKKLGFRSSFNFVGCDYPNSQVFFEKLRHDGFEVGLHGLRHNGDMFKSSRKFLQSASEINRLLNEFQVGGFRAPSMYHDLALLSHLNIDYDSSTFDTDPFEPQPEGVTTIFPFNVTNGALEKSFVELPYTLPQDFLVFVLLKQHTTDIWKKKLDWIAERGGMALLITHPDYMYTGERASKFDEYPIGLYEEFLHFVKRKYDGQYWHVLPREVAHFWKEKIAFTVQL